MSWFSRAAGVAERHGLSLWRARALHELATVSLLRDLSLNDLHQARQAALDAGAAGLLASVDFHIAAIHGVRFEPDLALAAGRRCLAEARRIGVVRQQAWGWILIGQAHACAGHRLQAATAAHEAVRLAPGDAEIAGLASGTYRGRRRRPGRGQARPGEAGRVATPRGPWVAGVDVGTHHRWTFRTDSRETSWLDLTISRTSQRCSSTRR